MLICMQKLNFITHFFLKILQGNSRLVILGNLGMPGHTCKMIVSIWRIFDVYLQAKNFSRFPRDISKILQTCYFGYFGQVWLHTSKILSPCRKLSYLSAGKRTTSTPQFSRRYCKDMQTSYFGYFGHVWIRTPKMVISTCRKFRSFSACQK